MIHSQNVRKAAHRVGARLCFLSVTLLFAASSVPALIAEDKAAKTDKKTEIPEPEDVSLETKDGVLLKATYYAGTNGKTTVPVIIVHDHNEKHEGQRTDFHELALSLQKNGGHAVIVPDLRGHGESTKYRKPSGDIGDLDKSKLRSVDYGNMVTQDMQAVKRFLRDKNNAGDLNLEQLCVVGVGALGTVTTLNFALADWSQPVLIGYKMGQDVKAMVLVSPAQNFEGNKTAAAMAHKTVSGGLSTLLVAGKKDTEFTPIYRLFESRHKKPTGSTAAQDLFKIQLEAEVKGAKLLDPRLGLGIDRAINNFIDRRLVQRQDEMPWSERKTPR